VSIARLHLVGPCVVLALVASSTGGCRTARPAVRPAAAAGPAPVVTPESHATLAVPPSEAPAGPPPAPLLEADASGERPEGNAEPEAAEEENAGPERIQKEALDQCQSAAELLRRG
jgi:hypothetical protein